MWEGFPLFPEQASTIAGGIDALYLFLVGLTAFFSVLIFTIVFVFSIIYRRRSEDERPEAIEGSTSLEIFWSVVPFGIVMVIFVWGASLYFQNARSPADAMEINVVGKQWMWKIQHPEGQREINELHVPVGRPVKLIMTSEDVIHSFFVPAFRIKMDVLPGRYTTAWFEATKPGEFHLFCAEYCGNEHSKMIGKVVVLDPPAYERWISGEGQGETLAQLGERRFEELRCVNCHHPGSGDRGPSLRGMFAQERLLDDGSSVIADEDYFRESILNPRAKIVAGFQPVMPTFQGQITEEQLLELIAYVRTLEGDEGDTP